MKMGWIAAIAVAASAALASAESMTFNFTLVPVSASGEGNNPENLGDQLSVTISTVDGDPTKVDFTFRNDVGVSSSISEIYFDDGEPATSLLSAMIVMQSGAMFEYGSASPGDLPGGNSLADPFNVSEGFLADRGSGNPTNGIDASDDYVTIRAMLRDGFTYDDVIARMLAGELRIGLHVISIGVQDGSDSYVTGGTPPPPAPPPPGNLVPLPSVAGLGMVGLVGVASRRRRS